jgi:enamine deaminase RidA (YjgF/YER057c/UK114 family)
VASAEIPGPRRLTAKFNRLQKPATSCPKRPPHTTVGVASLAAPEFLIEIEAIAVL